MPTVAEQVVAAIVEAVPAYADPFRGRLGRTIETAVRVALEGFIDLASRPGGLAAGTQVEFVHQAAYDLGRGEARSGRSMDALSQAYRVGARVAWQDMSHAAVLTGIAADEIARFAELVFAYIDELSAISLRGHVEELASSGQLLQRRRERLFAMIVEGLPAEELTDAAERGAWYPPHALVAVVVPEADLATARRLLHEDTLAPGEDIAALEEFPELTAMLVPIGSAEGRRAILAALRDQVATVGPARPWQQARSSVARALQASRLGLSGDTDLHLTELVLRADQEALTDLRDRVLAPLDGLSPTARAKLVDTLRAWLLYQGRRDEIAEALFVHPQTVRYRMGQLRERFGDRLTNPRSILELTVALGASGT